MNNFIQVLRIRPFLFLWLSELFSQIAMNTMNFILILLAYSLANSNTSVSGIILSFTVPSIIFGIIAGVFVDRWDKKSVLLWANILRGIFLLFLSIWHTNLVVLYAFTFCVAIVTQFFIPAETPMIPILVKRDLLIPANALFSMALFGSMLIAYGLSGSFLIFFGQSASLVILCVVFLIAAVFAWAIKVPQIKEKKNKLYINKFNFMEEVSHTVRSLLSMRDVLHAFSLLVLTQVFVLIISVLGPGYAKNILRIDINKFPLLFVFPAIVGMAVGSYVVANFLHMRSRHKTATLGIFIGAISVFMLPYALYLHSNSVLSINQFVIFMAFLLGFSNSLMFVPSNTLIQEHTSESIRGKIYGALNSVASAFSFIPVIVVGGFADIFGVGNVLYGLGIVIGLIGVFRLAL